MRNKNFIIGVAFIVLVILGAILAVLLTPREKDPESAGGTFGDTSGERGVSVEETVVFGNVDELLMGEGAPDAPKLRLLTKERVIGAVPYATLEGSTTVEHVRFIERASGHILDTPLATVSEPRMVSQKTMLRTGSTDWSPSAESVLVQRYNETADTVFSYLGTVTPEAGSDTGFTLRGRPLPNNLVSGAFSPDGQKIFYIVPSEQGSVGYVEHVYSGAREEVWRSALNQLTAVWGGDQILVYTNPTGKGEGVVWAIDSTTYTTKVLLGRQVGLMALVSRDGTKLLYSHFENDSGVPALKSLSLATGDMTYLPIPTLAEKCAWGNPGSRFVYCAVPRQQPRASFIDEWYQGLATSDDVLWRFDLVTGEAKQLVDLYEELKVRIDAVNLLVSSDEHYLVFRSLRNDYLWALELPYEAPQTETTPVETPNETP